MILDRGIKKWDKAGIDYPSTSPCISVDNEEDNAVIYFSSGTTGFPN